MSVSKFKVGDKVKVRKGLVVDEYYDGVLQWSHGKNGWRSAYD